MLKLAQWLLGAFTTIAAFFAKFVTRRFAIALAGTTVMIAMTATVFAVIHGLIAGMAITISNQYLLMGITALLPDNFEICVSVYFSARMTLWAYNLNKDLMFMYLGGI